MNRYAVAARRARLLADVVCLRLFPLEDRETVGLIVAYLDTAAARLDQYPAPATDEPNGIPRNLAADVDALRTLMTSVPIAVPVTILGHITGPLTGEPVTLAPLGDDRAHLRYQERKTVEALDYLAARLDDPSDELLRATLDGLVTLHRRYQRLAGIAPAGPSENTVHVRTGTYRRAYHRHAACPALTGKPASYSGQQRMTELAARAEGLTACRRCPA
ncbi:hypothetical protein ACQPXT_13510 [Streptomyces sp. CA-100214]